MRILVVLLFIIATNALAQETWIVATVASHHFTDQKFNQHNYGIGFESSTRFSRVSVVGGAYDNSMRRTSAYAGAAWTPLGVGDFHAGAIAGLVSGYANHPVFAVLPTVQWEGSRFGANVYASPKVGDQCAVIGFQIKVKL